MSLSNIQLQHSKLHPATSLLSVPYLWHTILPWSSLFFLVSVLFNYLYLPPPSYHPHNCFIHSCCYETSHTSAPLTSPLNNAKQGTCLSTEMYKPLDRAEGEYQTVSVCVFFHPTPTLYHQREGPLITHKSNESGCPQTPWQKIWSLKCPHSPSPLCQKSLHVIYNANEADFGVFNFFRCFSASRTLIQPKEEKNTPDDRNKSTNY